ncbi:MAG: type II toxin-antitoxin system HicB family antitoxin [Rubrobacteraceae bacterium]
MSRRYVAVLIPDPEDGGYVASVPAVPGVYGQGETEEEAYQDVTEALRLMLTYLQEEGRETPVDLPPEGRSREIELAI